MLCSGWINAQSWFTPHAELNIPDKPNSENFQELIGINLQKTLSKIEFNESNPFPYRGTFSTARSFHLMELDYLRGFNPEDIELLPNLCDCETVAAPNPDLNCGYNAQCDDLTSPNARSGFTDWKTWYCAWRSEAFGFNEIYASIEAIDFKPSGTGTCPNGSERRSYPSKWYTADEWGGTANEIARQNSKRYVKAFIKTFCPDPSEGRPCMIEVLEVGNEPWGVGMDGIHGDAGDTPGVEGYKQIILGAVDACREEYGDDVDSWPMKISTAAFDAFGPDPGVVTTSDGSDKNRYIGKMIPDEAKPYISFVSLHPYGLPLDYSDLSNPKINGQNLNISEKPESDNGLYLTLKNMIDWKNNNGMPHADVNITEFGWNDDNGGESLCYAIGSESQSAYTVRAYLLAARYDVHRAFAYGYTKNNEWLYCATHFLDDRNDDPHVSDFVEKKMHAAIRKWTSSDIADKRFLSVLGSEDYADDGNIVYVLGNEAGTPTHLVAWKANVLDNSSTDADFFANENTAQTTIALPSNSLTVSNGNKFFYLNSDDSRDGDVSSRGLVEISGDNSNVINLRLSGTPIVIELDPTNCQYNDEGELINCDVIPTCYDNVQNGDETDVDCGGSCPECEEVVSNGGNNGGNNNEDPNGGSGAGDENENGSEGTPIIDVDCIAFDLSGARLSPFNSNTQNLINNQPSNYPPTNSYSDYDGWTYPNLVYVDLGSVRNIGNLQLYSKGGNNGVIHVFKGQSENASDRIGIFEMNTEGWIFDANFESVATQFISLKRISGFPKVSEMTICTNADNRPPSLPGVFLSTENEVVYEGFEVEVAFTEPVEGVEINDFFIENGRITSINGSEADYTINVEPIEEGLVTISFSELSAQSNNGSGNMISNFLNIEYLLPTCFDNIQNGNETDVDCGGDCEPCGTVGVPPVDDCTYFDLSNATIQPLTASGLNLINSQPGAFPPTTTYNTFNGWVYPNTIQVDLRTVQNIGGIQLYSKAGNLGTVEVYAGDADRQENLIGTFTMDREGWIEADDLTNATTQVITLKRSGGSPKVEELAICTGGGTITPEPVPPTIVLSTPQDEVNGNFEVMIDFDMQINGLTADDFEIINGTITSIDRNNGGFIAQVVPTNEGLISIQLPAGAVQSDDGLDNLASNIVDVVYLILPTCDDGIQNGNETNVDCGGDCQPCDHTGSSNPEDCTYFDMSNATIEPSYGSSHSLIDNQPGAYPPTTTYSTFNGWVYPSVVYINLGSPQVIGDIQLYSKHYNNGTVEVFAGQSEAAIDKIGTYDMGAEGWVSANGFIPTVTQFITLKRTSGTPKVEEISICASPIDPDQATRQESLELLTAPISNSHLRVFPNPADAYIDVAVTRATAGETMLQIVNGQGQVVYQYPLVFVEGENQVRLDINDLASGLYYIWLPEGHQKKDMVKFIKQR